MVPQGVVSGAAALVDTFTNAGCLCEDRHVAGYEAADAAISITRRLEGGAGADGWDENKDGMMDGKEDDMSCCCPSLLRLTGRGNVRAINTLFL